MLKCVIFDLDNTLVDSDLDFSAIKAEIGTTEPILEHRAQLDAAGQRRVDEILDRHERRAAESCGLCQGAPEMMAFLRQRRLKTALLTRNSRASVNTVLRRHALQFDCIVAREDSAPKPSPEPVRLICRRLAVEPRECMLIGDYLFDIEAGQAAGTATLLLDGPHRKKFTAKPDYEAATLHQAVEILSHLLEKEPSP